MCAGGLATLGCMRRCVHPRPVPWAGVHEVKGCVPQGKGVPGMSRTVPGTDIPALCVPGVQCVVMCEPVRDCVCATPIVGCGVLHACVCIGVCFVRSMRGYTASAWCVWALVAVQNARVCRGFCAVHDPCVGAHAACCCLCGSACGCAIRKRLAGVCGRRRQPFVPQRCVWFWFSLRW